MNERLFLLTVDDHFHVSGRISAAHREEWESLFPDALRTANVVNTGGARADALSKSTGPTPANSVHDEKSAENARGGSSFMRHRISASGGAKQQS